jgi:DNA-binding NarL/FixJ family response regulator
VATSFAFAFRSLHHEHPHLDRRRRPGPCSPGFRKLLESEPGIALVAEAADGMEAVEAAGRLHPDVVLMDIRMPRLDGLKARRRILDAVTGTRVLILTTFDLDEYVFDALKAGASGFLLKDSPPDRLVTAIHVVANGDALLDPSITAV